MKDFVQVPNIAEAALTPLQFSGIVTRCTLGDAQAELSLKAGPRWRCFFMTRLLLWTAVAVNAASSLVAGTIYSVTGPLISGGAIDSNQSVGVSWTQTIAYSDVLISATVNGSMTDVLTAYLTTNIGPGTTVANEITHASVVFPGPSFTNLPLLNIPLLPAGTYYLTLSSSGLTGGLAETTSPSQIIGMGVTRNPDYYTSTPAAYPPGSSGFLGPPIAGLFVFSATGNAVPEPAAGTLVATTSIGLLLRRALTRRADSH
jgi:hypothetical protein